MHYYKFNIADWQSSTRHLTPEEEGVYFRLINHYYDTEKPIPLETESVIRRLMLGNCKDIVNQILSEFFVKTAQGYEKEKCNELIKEYRKNSKKNKANGAKGGRPRKDAALKETQSVSSGNPEISQEEPKHNPNYKPLTTNQELETKNIKDMRPQAVTPTQKNKSEAQAKPKKTQKQFIKPTQADVAGYCQERNNFVDPERWFNHYESNGWKVGKNSMKDWKAAVRTWEKNSFQNTGNQNANNQRSNNQTGEFDFLDEDTGWMQEIYESRRMHFEPDTSRGGDVQREPEVITRDQTSLENLGNTKP